MRRIRAALLAASILGGCFLNPQPTPPGDGSADDGNPAAGGFSAWAGATGMGTGGRSSSVGGAGGPIIIPSGGSAGNEAPPGAGVGGAAGDQGGGGAGGEASGIVSGAGGLEAGP